jgi:phage-related protein
MAELKRLPATFYQSVSGSEPVRVWLRGLNAGERKTLGLDIATVEFGWPVGMPVCRALGGGLWEVRSNLPGGKIARVLFCVAGGRMVLLEGFIKKSRATPKAELELARRRMKGVAK